MIVLLLLLMAPLPFSRERHFDVDLKTISTTLKADGGFQIDIVVYSHRAEAILTCRLSDYLLVSLDGETPSLYHCATILRMMREKKLAGTVSVAIKDGRVVRLLRKSR